LKSQTAVARGATSLYVANVTNLVANTLYFLILTNILPSTLDVGVITALNITIWLLVTVCVLAQPVTLQSPVPAPLSVLKFIPEFTATKDPANAKRVYRASIGTTALLGVIVAGVLMLAPDAVGALIGGTVIKPDLVRLAGLDVLVLSLGQVAVAALIAVGDTRTASVYIIVWSIARYAIASVLLVLFSLAGVLVGWMIGDAVLSCLALLRGVRQFHGGTVAAYFKMTDLAKYSLYTVFSALIGFAVNQADKVFTLASQGLRELAIYNVAIVAATFTGFAPYALLTVLLPALSSLNKMNRREEIHSMVRDYTRYVSLVVLPIAMGFAAITEVALRIFGQQYVAGLVPSVIVSVATGLTAVGVVYAALLIATGDLGWFALANVVGLGALFGVSAMSSEILGLSGPALGRASLMAVTALIYAFAVSRRGYLHLDVRAFLVATCSSIVMAFTVFLLLSSIGSFLMRVALLPVIVALGAVIYIGGLRALHLLTKDDLEFAQGIVPEKLQPVLLRTARLLGIS
jgi:O-antigen/teichoic acid export membrane protein